MKSGPLVGVLAGFALATGGVIVALPAQSAGTTFTNTTPITINNPPTADPAAADPYPSAITVAGLSGVVTDVNVTIKGFSHHTPEDVSILLRAPLIGPIAGLTRSSVLMADTGCRSGAVGIDLTFDDEATASLPDGDAAGSVPFPPTGSVVKPTRGTNTDCFPSVRSPLQWPLPAGAVTTTAKLASFIGMDPNVTWELFVIDDNGGGTTLNQIAGGWELEISTAPATVSIEATDPGATEAPGDPGGLTVTRTGDLTDPLVVNLATTGTATTGTDYAAVPATVTIPANAFRATVPVTPLDDSADELEETVLVTVGPGTGYAAVPTTTSSAAVTIYDDELTATTVDFTLPTSAFVGETLTLTPTVTSTVTGRIPPGSVVFTGPESTTCTATLTGGTGSCSMPVSTTGTIEILASYAGSPDYSASQRMRTIPVRNPTVALTADDATATESGPGTGSFTISRDGPTTAALIVTLSEPTGTASSADYATLPATVTIPVGSSSNTVTITPVDDTADEPDETVILILAQGVGYAVGPDSLATVTIADDDLTPTVTSLASSVNPSLPGQSVTFTATVTSAAGTPPGTVNFRDGTVVVCDDIPLSSAGVATCTTTALGTTRHTLTSAYSGNAVFAASTATLEQTVAAPAPVRTASATCNGVAATLVGTEDPERLVGTSGRDVIVGLGGNDTIDGLGGNDLICAGNGDDRVDAGNGHDVVFGGRGMDQLYGQAGNDTLVGEKGRDTLRGGAGNDTLLGGRGRDAIYGDDGFDTGSGGPGRDTAVVVERRRG